MPADAIKEQSREDSPDSGEPPATTVRVDLGDRSYDIRIGPGLIANAAGAIGQACPNARCAVVTDQNVAETHLPSLERSLSNAEQRAGTIVLPPGEATKSFSQLEWLCDRLLELGVERGDVVIALGGGVIGDITGFAASILRRGVRIVQIPTSLLAQVDSSVGGKTGVNTPRGKNLIGTFHQPSLVLADTNALDTLPDRQLRAGYAEVVKYALLGDAEFFQWLQKNAAAVIERDAAAVIKAIEISCKAKAAIVAGDEREHGNRALLNLGHTFGHALEAWAGYSDRLLHGEAIAIGMALAFRFSERTGRSPEGTAVIVEAHLQDVGLPTRIGDVPGDRTPTVSELEELMAQDKKVERGRLNFILAHGIGQAFIADDVDPGELEHFLESEIAGPACT